MSVILIVAAVVGVIVVLWAGTIYNDLVQVRNNVDKAWENIDVLLMQRYDELPKLIDTCRAYMEHERDVLESLTEMRTRYKAAQALEAKAAIENEVQQKLTQLGRVWEGYPDLRSTENFQKIQGRISALEESIADRREFFNDSVNIYNIRIESVPDTLIAKLFGYRRKPFLDVPDEKTRDVAMDFQKAATSSSAR